MTPNTLSIALAWWLSLMRTKGVTFEVNGDELLIDGPDKELTEGRLRDLREHKTEVVTILKGSKCS